MIRYNQAFSSFSVNDLQQAKQFYTETLGMQVSEGEYTLDLRLGGEQKVLIYPKPNHTPASFTILNFPVDNIEEEVENLKRKGIQFEIYKEPNLTTDANGILRGEGPLIAWFKDPFGNILSIIQE